MALLPFWRRRRAPATAGGSTLSSDPYAPENLHAGLHSLIEGTLHRAGIPPRLWDLKILLAEQPNGRPVLSAKLRLKEWDLQAGVRLLLGFPILERSVRRKFAGSWMHDASDFDRLWLSLDSAVDDEREMLHAVRSTILSLEHARGEPEWAMTTIDPRVASRRQATGNR